MFVWQAETKILLKKKKQFLSFFVLWLLHSQLRVLPVLFIFTCIITFNMQACDMFSKHSVASVTTWKQLFRRSGLECKTRRVAVTRGCRWSSWLVEGSAVVSVWLMTFPEACASCGGLARLPQKKRMSFFVKKRDLWLAVGFSSWPDFSRCKTDKSSDHMQIRNSEMKKKHNL